MPARSSAPLRGVRLTGAGVVLCLGLMCAANARAGDERDHERARAAVQAGEVLALPVLLERLRRTHPGQVMELELERDGGRWIYEIKLLQPDGALLKLDIDAATGQVLQAARRRDRGKDPAEDRDKRREPGRDKSRQGERQQGVSR